MGKFSSRKFLTMLFGALGAICAGLAGALPWTQALAGAGVVVCTYLVAQAGADAAAVAGASTLTSQGGAPTSDPALVPAGASVVPVGASVVPAGALPPAVLVVPVLPQDLSG